MIFEVGGDAHVRHQDGAKASEALASRVAHAAIDQAVRPVRQKCACESLGGHVTRGVVVGDILRRVGPHVVEHGVEIGLVEAHLHARFEHADFRQLYGAMIDGLGMCGRQRTGGVPGPTFRAVKAAAGGARMAKCRHNHARHGAACDPLLYRNAMEGAQFRGNAVVTPGFQLEDQGQVRGTRNRFQNASGGVQAGTRRQAPVRRSLRLGGVSSTRRAFRRVAAGRGRDRRSPLRS